MFLQKEHTNLKKCKKIFYPSSHLYAAQSSKNSDWTNVSLYPIAISKNASNSLPIKFKLLEWAASNLIFSTIRNFEFARKVLLPYGHFTFTKGSTTA